MPKYTQGQTGNPDKQFKRGDERTIAAARKSAEVRKNKRNCQQLAQMILQQQAPMSKDQRKQLAKIFGISPSEITVGLVAAFQQGQKAAKGDLAALTYLRDTAGEKPTENVAMEATIASGNFVLELGGSEEPDAEDETGPGDDQ